jgi:predicted PurR-regulated permease PerM
VNASDDHLARERRERWWRSSFLILATVYVLLLLIGLVVRVLGGFIQIAIVLFVAWLLAFVLSPVVAWLEARRSISRGVAIGLVYLATLLGSGFLLFYAASSIGASAAEMAEDYPQIRANIEMTLREWQAAVSFGRFEPNFVRLFGDVEETGSRLVGSVLGEVPEVTVAVLGSLVLVIILSLYMLADSQAILAKFGRIVPTRYADEVEILERTVSRAFGGFLRAQVILAGIQTLLTLAVVILVGLPYGFVITGASALAMLIPFFGPPLALIPPILATVVFNPDWVLVVGPVLLIVQTVLVNYLQPKLMREALGMHPILVLVGLLVGAQVAGVWCALFGIPVIAVLNVFFNYFVNLRTIEETAEPTEDVLEEMRQKAPEATHEELVAMAADHVEEEAEEMEEHAEVASGDLRSAAGELRAAAGEQRQAADEIGGSARELRRTVERLNDDDAPER